MEYGDFTSYYSRKEYLAEIELKEWLAQQEAKEIYDDMVSDSQINLMKSETQEI